MEREQNWKMYTKTRTSAVLDEFPDTNGIIIRSGNQFLAIASKQDRSNTISMNF